MTNDHVFRRGEGGSNDIDTVMLICLMVHPSDQQRRDELLSYLMQPYMSAILDSDPSAALPPKYLDFLGSAAKRGVGEDIDRAVVPGCIAGETLIVLLQMARTNNPRFGSDRALHAAQTLNDRRPTRDGGRVKASTRETVRNHWRAYRRSAHLWAAYVLFCAANGSQPTENLRNRFVEAAHSGSLAATAESLRRTANAHPLPNGESILPEDSFVLEGFGDPDPQLVGLEMQYSDLLENFKPRGRQ